jgi:hypothetical protein
VLVGISSGLLRALESGRDPVAFGEADHGLDVLDAEVKHEHVRATHLSNPLPFADLGWVAVIPEDLGLPEFLTALVVGRQDVDQLFAVRAFGCEG